MDLGMYRWRVKIQQSINNTWSWCWGDSALKFKHFSHVWLFMKKYLFRTHWCFPGCLYSLDLLHLCHNGTAIFFWQILCWLVFHRVLQLVWFLPQHLRFSFIIHLIYVETCKALQNFGNILCTFIFSARSRSRMKSLLAARRRPMVLTTRWWHEISCYMYSIVLYPDICFY